MTEILLPAKRPIAGRVMRNVTIAATALMFSLGAPLSAQDNPGSLADLAESVSPAVVNITTSTVVREAANDLVVPEGSPFEDLFRDFQNQTPDQRERRGSALGSGFIISADGYVVTNNHVIADADQIEIELFSGEVFSAELVGADPRTDLALLKIDAGFDLPFVPFGDSDVMRVGDWVLAIGNPLGQGFSVSAGIVSARNRTLSGNYDDFIQTDAAINRGNSGGPLFNMQGEVVGVNTAILSPSGGSIGIGFSMASNVVSGVVDQLREFGETRRGWLGVRIQNLTPEIAESLGLDSVDGALVSDVPDGPARDAGIEAGDVILKFAGLDIASTRELVRRVAEAPVGEEVSVEVMRNGQIVELAVKLGRLEEAMGDVQPELGQGNSSAPAEAYGMSLSLLDNDLRGQFGLGSDETGVVITAVEPGSEAAGKGLRAGDIIVEVNQELVSRPSDIVDQIRRATDSGRRTVLMLVRRDGNGRFVALAL
ncbi:DegQ family serine endoprotease [Abyssibius alkaniclasticus]|uniref:DegQ family serine endoprotease n=1 Tax=Abyssibius alkaniclasticus TaxID=2881234 RepID=UPI004059E3D0|tara:strand:+ start:934 stop:2382 length:1449 start_codon:yes stop_codon:yes gene_type:complete